MGSFGIDYEEMAYKFQCEEGPTQCTIDLGDTARNSNNVLAETHFRSNWKQIGQVHYVRRQLRGQDKQKVHSNSARNGHKRRTIRINYISNA